MFIKRNYRLRLDETAPTVTSHCLDEFVHPVSNRALTVRECARLQSFPDSYDFCGGPYIVPHIGNAEMGEAAKKAVEEYHSRLDLEVITDKQVIQVEDKSYRTL